MYDSELAEEEERRRKRAPWGVIALVLLTGLALIRNGSGEFDVGPPQPASAAAAPDTRAAPGDAAAPGVTPLPYSVPDRVSIPAIQVDAPVMGVGLDADGWVDAPPPEDPNLAGWFTGAVSPGEKGTAVVVGHVDNQQGPAVFYGLGALKKGNKVEIHRQDGKTAVFEIYGIEVFEKDNFPGDRVYGSKGTPELRVITCGGGFTKQNGYDGNVVAFARLAEVR
ncbi:class F sortase [Streptomyces ardesiacus]|uniref:class F sortase n=1 Tax=Streptomyces ardesiacus TaxID=285564 RepID=UPI00201F4F8A|nr:class F sortase [Streptomyces ardesiacus]MCL7369364.1 class F sortase [Streptomyces ardesiacus]